MNITKRISIDFLIAAGLFILAAILNRDILKLLNENPCRLMMIAGLCMAVSSISSIINFSFLNWEFNIHYIKIKLTIAIILLLVGAFGQVTLYHSPSPIFEKEAYEKDQEGKVCKWIVTYYWIYNITGVGMISRHEEWTLFIDTKTNMLLRMNTFIEKFEKDNPDKKFSSFFYKIDTGD